MIKVDWIRVVYTKDRGRYYGYVETDRGCTSVETREEFDFHRGFLVPWRKGNIYLPNVGKLLDYYNNRRTGSLWVSLRGKTRPDERYKGYIIHDKGIIYDQENRIPDRNRYAVYPDRPGERYEILCETLSEARETINEEINKLK